MKDPLDLFNATRPVHVDIPIKLYPGNTPPRAQVAATPVLTNSQELLNSLPSAKFMVDGREVQCYTIGAVAKVLGREVVTIRAWEAKGWLPKKTLRTRRPEGAGFNAKAPKGRRLYTRDQVEYLMEAHSRFHLDKPQSADWQGFINHMKTYPSN